MDISDTIAALRRLAPASAVLAPDAAAPSLGVEGLDDALGGGLRMGALHEVYAAEPMDAAAAAGFALGLASVLMRTRGGALFWLRQTMAEREFGRPYAPGLAEAGVDPRRLVVVQVRRTDEMLDAALQAARALGGGVVLMEPGARRRIWT